MIRQFLQVIVISTFALVLFSCNTTSTNSMQKNVTGKAGELVIVINKQIWDGTTGDLVFETLSQAQAGLPQIEPILDVINIPHDAFGDIFKTTRSIIMTNISSSVEKPGVVYQRDVYAYTQAYVTISAKNVAEFKTIFEDNSDKIIGFLLKAERERIISNYSKYNEKEVSEATKEIFGITLNVPPGFKVREKEKDFMWIIFDTPEISQGILISSYPYYSEDAFTEKNAIVQRNLLGKHKVPGPTEGSYLTTETEVPLLYNTLQHNGNYAAELRGLWKVANDFMGGPFVSLSVLDVLNQHVVVLDAYVYAPQKNKRNYLRQLEGMIYSMEFTNQAEIDKVLKQYEL